MFLLGEIKHHFIDYILLVMYKSSSINNLNCKFVFFREELNLLANNMIKNDCHDNCRLFFIKSSLAIEK
jgi:hypothetical protein